MNKIDMRITLQNIQCSAETALKLGELLEGTFNCVEIKSNGVQCPVPAPLLERWKKDLEDHRDLLVKELTDATK